MSTEVRQEQKKKTWLNEDTPTLKRGDEAAHFLHAPLTRSGWKEVGPLTLEAPGSQAVGRSGAVAGLGAWVRRGRRQRGRIVLVLVPIAGHVLWAAGLRVTLKFTASFTSVLNLLFCTGGLLLQASCHVAVSKWNLLENYGNECVLIHKESGVKTLYTILHIVFDNLKDVSIFSSDKIKLDKLY